MKQEEAKAYLKRIGYTEDIQKDKETLNGLIRAHLEQVPFENLDVCEFGEIPSLDEGKLFEKIVEKNRGGYCFELNTLFLALLRALGFTVYPVAVRVLWNRDILPPVSHMALVVRLSDGKYLCDVGYGGPGPKGLLSLGTSVQEVAGECFQVRERAEELLVERAHGEIWKAVLQFHDQPFLQQDFQLLNFYCAANPAVIFSHKRVVNLCTAAGSKALTEMELVIREGEQTVRRQLQNEKELKTCLEEEFGLCNIKTKQDMQTAGGSRSI